MRSAARWFSITFAALCLLSFIVLIAAGSGPGSRWSLAWRCDGRDAITYYYAALGAYEGLSPYDRGAILQQLNEAPFFVYPIFALPLFMPLIIFGPKTALILFGILHLICLAGLVALWRRLLPIDWRLLVLLLPVGFGGASVHDLCSGNVVAFESLALWLGVAALWRGRPRRFAALIGIAAMPKLLWLALLPLALWRSLSAWRSPAAVIALAVALFGGWLLLWPIGLLQWLGNMLSTRGVRYNVFTILRDLDHALGGDVGGPPWLRWEAWVYAAWLAVVVVVLIMTLRQRAGMRSLSLLAPLTLLAVWPGNLSYSWLVVLPVAAAVVFFLASRGSTAFALLLALLCILPQPLLDWSGFGLAFGQGTFITILVFWVVLSGIVLRNGEAFETWLCGAIGPGSATEPRLVH